VPGATGSIKEVEAMKQVWSFAAEELAQGRPVVLVAVVHAAGSVPGKPGAMMMVGEHDVAGTVGGGIAESSMMTAARQPRSGPELTTFSHTAESGSLCHGAQTMAVYPLGTDDLPRVQEVAGTLERDLYGMLQLSPAGLAFTPGTSRPRRFEHSGDDEWSWQDTIGLAETLYVVGGGHVSLALSRVMATLPFRIVVLDDRDDLPTMQLNRHAHETRVIDYGQVREHVAEGDRSWVVIMTHGHRHDQSVLERLIDGRYRYIGLMGSDSKVARLFESLRARGVSQADLEHVHAPIGLAIGSHTPAEIAISIAAELIQVRNNGNDAG
jgi:xanthine dehydrogenase accessory factor